MLVLLLLMLVQAPVDSKTSVDEIQVSDLDETITLCAEGTVEYRFRGRPNDFISDERVGFFTAKLEPRQFKRLVAELREVNINKLDDFYLPYSQHIVHLTLKQGGREKLIEIHDRKVPTDPEPPDRLWRLEMAARGLASIQKWEPIKTGFKVRFKGVSEELRDIVIREPESQFPVVIIRSQKELVELPLKPGRYSIEVALLRDGRWTDSIKTPATVGNEEYTEVSLDQ